MNKGQKTALAGIILGAVLFVTALLLPLEGIAEMISFIIVYLVVGYNILFSAVRNIGHGNFLDENFLMAIASIGAMCLGEYHEAIAVLLFYRVGDLFESIAVGRSRNSISALMDIRPDVANLLRDGEFVEVDPYEVIVGDIIRVGVGEKVPLDGIIVKGSSAVDTAALTGESLPRDLEPGDEILSGSISLSGVLEIKVTKEFEESTVSKILDLVENASSNKAITENFITRFAKYYTPCVVAGAVLLAFLPPLLIGFNMETFGEWVHRALIFLVISCPCALVISVPLSFFGGIGSASKNGILVKGSNYLELLAKAETVIFDKTGTLTEGKFSVTEIHPVGISEGELLELVALAEGNSPHPIAESLRRAYGKELDLSLVEDTKEIAGYGLSAVVKGIPLYLGKAGLLTENGIKADVPQSNGTVVCVGNIKEKQYLGCLIVADAPKADSAEAIKSLKEQGVKKTIMLTGDRQEAGQYVGKNLGLDEVYCNLLPGDKVEKALKVKEKSTGPVAFVGDGINDAPVLATVDIGVAMGGLGSDAAIEAADIVIMDDKPSKLALAIKIAGKTKSIVWQNIIFALSVKFIVMIMGALGIANMWEAIFADVGVSVLAILNSFRAMYIGSLKK